MKFPLLPGNHELRAILPDLNKNPGDPQWRLLITSEYLTKSECLTRFLLQNGAGFLFVAVGLAVTMSRLSLWGISLWISTVIL
jgi:hypothetical protein